MSTIAAVKDIPRFHRQEYLRLIDPYSCGSTTAEHINPEIEKHRIEYENALEVLKKIDPMFPKSKSKAKDGV